MKNFSIILFILFSINLFSQNSPHYFAEPQNITVYQSGATISTNIDVNLKKGTNYIYLDSLPLNVDKNTIIVNFMGKASVMSIDYKLEVIKTEEIKLPPNMVILEDSLKELQYNLTDLKNQIDVLNGEEKVIASYKMESFHEKNAKVQDLITLAQYYNKRINEIRSEILDNNKEINILNSYVTAIQTQINNYRNSLKPINNWQIIASVSSEKEGTFPLVLSYFVHGSGWNPAYDIVVNDLNNPVKILYKGFVYQNTGRDWNDVKLTLSTRNPNMSGTLPVMQPWYLRLYSERLEKTLNVSVESDDADALYPASNIRGSRSSDTQIRIDGLDVGTMANKYFSVEYSPSARYSIKSDNQKQGISLNETDVPAIYEHFAVPKVDPDAFLIAKIANWGDLRLLSGEANIYFENSYIGKTYINPNITEDTLTLSLGRDKSLIIARTQISEFSETKFLSSNVEKTEGYKTSIKNNRKNPVKITIQDQIPLSTHEKIEVEIIEKSGAEIEKSTGFAKWIINIAPNKTEEVKLIYKIDMPKSTTIR